MNRREGVGDVIENRLWSRDRIEKGLRVVHKRRIRQRATGRGIEGGGRLGLINYDIPPYNRAIDQYVKPALTAAGIALTQYTIPPPTSTPDISNAVAVDQSAELKMRSQGIGTVMFLCSGCLIFFANAAKSQQYFPRYIFSSLDGPVGLTDQQTYGSAIGIGWEPVSDQNTFASPNAFTTDPTYNL